MWHLEIHESWDSIPMQDWWDVEEQIFNALNYYLNTSPDSEVSTIMWFLRDSIVDELEQIVGSNNYESISKNIESQGSIFMFPLSDGRKLCFNILNFLKNPPEAMYLGDFIEITFEIMPYMTKNFYNLLTQRISMTYNNLRVRSTEIS